MENAYINLTQAQRYCFRKIFADLDAELLKGNIAAVLAQVYPDGIRATVISGREFKVVQAALGGDKKIGAATLSEYIDKNFKE